MLLFPNVVDIEKFKPTEQKQSKFTFLHVSTFN